VCVVFLVGVVDHLVVVEHGSDEAALGVEMEVEVVDGALLFLAAREYSRELWNGNGYGSVIKVWQCYSVWT
jgi:hypothetical protein